MTTEPESNTQTQVRLVLEQRCADTFRKLYKGKITRYPFTLVAFDFGNQTYDNVAFKTSLTMPALADAFSALLEGWLGRAPRFSPDGVDSYMIRQLAEDVKDALPGLGFIALLGDSASYAYVSNAERTSVAKLIRNDLLPEWCSRD
jgi:hypothetical protein